ncbi:MAG: phospho-N-acetylmuramoyl-pentapeptide-transferase [Armatimonadota bacterium]|nr:phospho-N-acetylmuramoyl-pentapeptide-transferase [Armatimonadota bacterium]MDR7439629.1 phospho-N-acetylmuramoyl-pentapeptide-transferase [Armatimonadota bacterium]MDR7563668.1 phospho-N-acetylmuramoyl-pentapeptide-transferase [Armatimonadota bacterium]MDR7566773.1 phospho-N-acetylmuramoyl-pentapeptide-transferase [Armatimonadota bacterium]MDR7601291.1 phospho-N-acetylmuramoyl-pentapeptide-transferase [Armatimonadota bacterium]
MERVILSAAVSGLVVLLTGRIVVPWLRRWAIQPISEDAPPRHRLKAGTPTLGGLMLIGAVLVATAVAAEWTPAVGIAALALCGYGAIGFWDDCRSVRRGRNLGLRAREKLALQLPLGFALGWAVARVTPHGSALHVPGVGTWELGGWYPVFAAVYVTGFVNATNLTDGLDGLAAGTAAVAFSTYAAIALRTDQTSLAPFAGAVAGACLGFLWYNAHPAQVMMGDVGSQALGGALATLALGVKAESALLVVGAVFVAEALSVMLQVGYFKASRGRRIFRSSPLHHHFELLGWSEPQIVTRFYVLAAFAALGGLLVVP